jgi:hypothetical protein
VLVSLVLAAALMAGAPHPSSALPPEMVNGADQGKKGEKQPENYCQTETEPQPTVQTDLQQIYPKSDRLPELRHRKRGTP